MSYYMYAKKEVLKNHVSNLLTDYSTLIETYENFSKIKSNFKNLEEIKKNINSKYNTDEEIDALVATIKEELKANEFYSRITTILAPSDSKTPASLYYLYYSWLDMNGYIAK